MLLCVTLFIFSWSSLMFPWDHYCKLFRLPSQRLFLEEKQLFSLWLACSLYPVHLWNIQYFEALSAGIFVHLNVSWIGARASVTHEFKCVAVVWCLIWILSLGSRGTALILTTVGLCHKHRLPRMYSAIMHSLVWDSERAIPRSVQVNIEHIMSCRRCLSL